MATKSGAAGADFNNTPAVVTCRELNYVEGFITRFNGKAHVPDQPVLSIARGLYKQAQSGRKRGA